MELLRSQQRSIVWLTRVWDFVLKSTHQNGEQDTTDVAAEVEMDG